MSSEFQTLVKSKSIASITPQQILDAGQGVFLDIQTSPDINAINKLIASFQHIHSPNYGQPIPLSGQVSSVDGSETLLAPDNQEVERILAISAENTGGVTPIVFDITLGGMIISYGNIVAPLTNVAVQVSNDLYASKNLPLAVAVTSGTAGELTTSCASIKISQ